MRSIAVGGALAFLISFFFLAVYVELEVAIASIISAFVSIAAMFLVDQGGRHRR